MKSFLAFAVAVALGVGSPAVAATLIVDGSGELTGALGVNVGGNLYDVNFIEGTCAEVFSGCDSVSDFAFTDLATATTAAEALLAQVFVGIYDDNPALTFGCEASNVCQTYFPYAFAGAGQWSIVTAQNVSAADCCDLAGGGGAVLPTTNSAGNAFFTYAVFTQSAVPEPGTWAMMLVGFGAIGFAMRRSRPQPRTQRA